jgi:hypothetical protein
MLQCVLLAVMANVDGQVRPLKCNTGYKYEYQGQLYVRYCTKKSVKYLKCVRADCPGRATLHYYYIIRIIIFLVCFVHPSSDVLNKTIAIR